MVFVINLIFSRKMKVTWDNFSASSSRDSESRVCRGDFSKDFAWIRLWWLKSPAALSQPPLWVNFQKGSSTDCSNLLGNLNNQDSSRGSRNILDTVWISKILSQVFKVCCDNNYCSLGHPDPSSGISWIFVKLELLEIQPPIDKVLPDTDSMFEDWSLV